MKIPKGLLFILLFYLPTTAASPWHRIPQNLMQDAYHMARVTQGIVSAPWHWDKDQWILAGNAVVLTAFLSAADAPLQRYAVSHRSPFWNRLFELDRYHGSTSSGVFSVSVYTAGLLLGKPKIRQLGLQAMEAFYLSGTVNLVFKILIGRRRPYAANSPYEFHPFKGTTEYRSLPSGHAVTAFAVSTVFARANDHILWKGLWYGSAIVVAGARVYHNAHWLSDVVPAAILGYAIGDYISRFPSQDGNPTSTAGLRWRLYPGIRAFHIIFQF